MSPRTTFPAAVTIAAALALRVILSPTPLAAQQDSSMMAHDSAMTMQGDSGMMPHDSTMMDHGQMMEHDHTGAGGMMFMGAEGQKASGDYEITEVGGKQQLKLTSDFAVAAARDLYLVLANGSTPDGDAIYIGKLKKTTGAQTFDLPKDKDLSSYSTLLVWSKKDKRAVASAEWHATAGKMGHM
jgi:hypothetical protein